MYLNVWIVLTVLQKEVHGKIPIGDHHSQGAWQLDGKGTHHVKRRPTQEVRIEHAQYYLGSHFDYYISTQVEL